MDIIVDELERAECAKLTLKNLRSASTYICKQERNPRKFVKIWDLYLETANAYRKLFQIKFELLCGFSFINADGLSHLYLPSGLLW